MSEYFRKTTGHRLAQFPRGSEAQQRGEQQRAGVHDRIRKTKRHAPIRLATRYQAGRGIRRHSGKGPPHLVSETIRVRDRHGVDEPERIIEWRPVAPRRALVGGIVGAGEEDRCAVEVDVIGNRAGRNDRAVGEQPGFSGLRTGHQAQRVELLGARDQPAIERHGKIANPERGITIPAARSEERAAGGVRRGLTHARARRHARRRDGSQRQVAEVGDVESAFERRVSRH